MDDDTREVVAFDCEFSVCRQRDGHRFSAVATVCVCDERGAVLFSSLSNPETCEHSHSVEDYGTAHHGVSADDLRAAPAQAEVVGSVQRIVTGKLVVGCGMSLDITACGLRSCVPCTDFIDVQLLPELSLPGVSPPSRPSLRALYEHWVGRKMREAGTDSSQEDACAIMELFRLAKQRHAKTSPPLLTGGADGTDYYDELGLADVSAPHLCGSDCDYVSRLNQLSQREHVAPPVYAIAEHAAFWRTSVSVGLPQHSHTVAGARVSIAATKKAAKQLAARALLSKLDGRL